MNLAPTTRLSSIPVDYANKRNLNMSSTPKGTAGQSLGVLLLSSSMSPAGTLPGDASQAAGPAAAHAPAPDLPADGVETRILVVEDERIVGLHLRQQLVKLGYNVVAVVSSGAEALKVVSDRRPDLVLMDEHIDGDMDGIETARRIPADDRIPVIYLTAYSGEPTLQR